MAKSILNSIKKPLNIADTNTAFDDDIIMHINSSFASLNQIIGDPVVDFYIEDATKTWADYLPTADGRLAFIPQYVFLQVKLIFDPPATAALLESTNKSIEKLESRIMMATDPPVVVPVVLEEEDF